MVLILKICLQTSSEAVFMIWWAMHYCNQYFPLLLADVVFSTFLSPHSVVLHLLDLYNAWSEFVIEWWTFCFIFGRSCFQISGSIPATLTGFAVFHQPHDEIEPHIRTTLLHSTSFPVPYSLFILSLSVITVDGVTEYPARTWLSYPSLCVVFPGSLPANEGLVPWLSQSSFLSTSFKIHQSSAIWHTQ